VPGVIWLSSPTQNTGTVTETNPNTPTNPGDIDNSSPTIGSLSGAGTVFNPLAINGVNSSNPTGGLLPNLAGGSGGTGTTNPLSNALIGLGAAGVIGAVTCSGVLGQLATAVGLGAGTTVVSGGASAVTAVGAGALPAGTTALAGSAVTGAGGTVAGTTLAGGTTAGSGLATASGFGAGETGGALGTTATGEAGGGGAAGAAVSVPVFDLANLLVGTGNLIISSQILGSTIANTALHSADTQRTFLGCLANTIAKTALQQITVSVVNWINSGFNGSPSFVTNANLFFANVANQAAGQFIQGSALSFLCSPFQLQIKIAVAQSYANQGASSCTLTGVINNVTNFMNGDFSSGGWAGMLSFTGTPTNNPYGAYAYASIGLQTAVNTAVSQQQNQLNQGRGFLSFQQQQNCTIQNTPPSTNPNTTVTTVTLPYNSNSSGNGTVLVSTGLTGGSNGAIPTRSVTQIQQASEVDPNLQGPGLGQNLYQVCNLVTTTPGSVIAGSIDKTLGLGADQLNLAKDFDDIVSALMSQLMTRALQGGLLNLSGSSGLASEYYTPDQIAAQAAGQTLLTQMQTDVSNAQAYGGTEQEAISSIETAQEQLNQLFNCWSSIATSSAAASQAEANAGVSSTTINNFNLEIDNYNNNITNANNAIAILESLESDALSAGSSADITSITSSYNSAQAQGQLITQNDVTSSEQDLTTLQGQLTALGTQTNTGLQQCNAQAQ
jgi:hypothetical protein